MLGAASEKGVGWEARERSSPELGWTRDGVAGETWENGLV